MSWAITDSPTTLPASSSRRRRGDQHVDECAVLAESLGLQMLVWPAGVEALAHRRLLGGTSGRCDQGRRVWPIASSAVCPNSSSAARFQLVMIPSMVELKMASPEPSTMEESCRRACSPALRSVMSIDEPMTAISFPSLVDDGGVRHMDSKRAAVAPCRFVFAGPRLAAEHRRPTCRTSVRFDSWRGMRSTERRPIASAADQP